MSKNLKDKSNISIQLDSEISNGIYSNLVIINHSASEFVFDFVSVMPGASKAKVRSRIILNPKHTKKFMTALSDNILRFEKTNGTIEDFDKNNIPLNFGAAGEA